MTPAFEPLAAPSVPAIVADALEVLERVGIAYHLPAAAALVTEAGGHPDAPSGRIRIPSDVVTSALATAPPTVYLYDAAGRLTHEIGGERQYFTPGSSAIAVMDARSGEARPPSTGDYVDYVRVVSGLPHFTAQSTAFVPADVPAAISDSYRLYLSLLHGDKPVVTGTFSAAACGVMEDLQLAVRGSREALESKPLTIYTCCPTSPLSWSADSAATLIACARGGIPVEIVPMPLAGFTAPLALSQTLVQLTAEVLSGVVLAQAARAGAPVLFGSAATMFDVRFSTTPLGSVEAMLLACGAAQIGRHLRLPTQAYIGLSDAKLLDAQAGCETAMGVTLAVMARINQVAGGGMLDFVNCFSTRKLVFDHEIVAAALGAGERIGSSSASVLPLIDELLREGHLLIAADTRRRLREEVRFPGAIVDRAARERWNEDGRSALDARADAEGRRRAGLYTPPARPAETARDLADRMLAEARLHGLSELPEVPCVT